MVLPRMIWNIYEMHSNFRLPLHKATPHPLKAMPNHHKDMPHPLKDTPHHLHKDTPLLLRATQDSNTLRHPRATDRPLRSTVNSSRVG